MIIRYTASSFTFTVVKGNTVPLNKYNLEDVKDYILWVRSRRGKE